MTAISQPTHCASNAKRAGKITPAEEVHHILPLSKGGTHVESNLMALCKRCHSEITAREGGPVGLKFF